jgi:spermidine/putrescine transport system permease protein
MINWIKKSYLVLIFTVLYLPILLLGVNSFNNSRSDSVWGGFSLRWYGELFGNARIMEALANTVFLAVVSALISTIVATMAAYTIYNMQGARKKILLSLNNIPILSPDLVTGISLMTLFFLIRIPLGFTSVLIAHVTFSIPYAVLCILPRLYSMPENTIEAAYDLGANEVQTFFRVVLPEILPGIVTALLITFTLSVDDFLITFFTTGNGFQNLSILIYSMTRKGINPSINALSTLMFAAVFLLLLVINSKTNLEKVSEQTRD